MGPPLSSPRPWPTLSALRPQVLPGLGGLPPGPSAAEERDGSEWGAPVYLSYNLSPQGKARVLWGLTLQVLKAAGSCWEPSVWWEAQLQP